MTRAPLDRDKIVDAAIALADEHGVGALSMRKLAKSLGYEVMSLYNHVASKNELLSLMVDEVAGEIGDPDADLAPVAAVRAIAMSTRTSLVRHPWAAEQWLRRMPGPERTRVMETLLRTLDRSGLSPEIAHHGFHAVINHVLGYTLQELGMAQEIEDEQAADQIARDYISGLSADEFPLTIAHVEEHLAGKTSSSFELVLDLIVDGLIRLDAG